MATSGWVADKPRGPRRQQLYESRREREFYRYYEPIRNLTEGGPPLCNLHDEAAVKAHLPFSSPDRALTAFCQLGALRLGTRRAMLFFFDSNYAYVLAEATRTLSLADDSVHEIEDKLWLGHSVIPRGFSICEETVCRLPRDDESPQSDSDRAHIHIINDLDKDVQFCDKPYVSEGPKAKFYAGVPVTTPKGIKIGAYCCLDDCKREGLDEKGITFMKDMAATVMTHLEMVRAKAEHERGTQMVCGLNAFVEGASSLQHWKKQNDRRDRRLVGRPVSPPAQPTLHALPSLAPPPAAHGPPSDMSLERNASSLSSTDSGPTVSRVAIFAGPEVATPAEPATTAPKLPARTSRHGEDLRDQLIASNVRIAFQRAAALVREAVDVDGAVFLDATPATYGGLVESTQDSSDQTSDASISGVEATGTESEGRWRLKCSTAVEKPCKVLASAHRSQYQDDNKGQLQGDTNGRDITEIFLRSLLRRHSHGKIWNFNQEGDASSDDESSEGCAQRRGCSGKPRAISDCSAESVKRKSRRSRAGIDDGREIQRLFPGVRSLALVGMWDANRGRWFSACAVWTYSPFRLFSTESEVNYMAAFCDVIMAEVHRLEAQNSDKAKSDFISSISHELRSPLHGILGSVEILQDQPIGDSFSQDLVSQIDICGRTLLDIVDHLLDYSKINHHGRTKRIESEGSNSRVRRGVSFRHSLGRKSQLGNMMAFDVDVALDHMTEEAIEAAVYSFCCARDKEFVLSRKVAVILDIDRSANINWRCKVPTGGWKRICINLCSNALKYTSEGFIKVSLKAEPIPGKERKSVIFTVSDSGRGMSKDFLENHLFKAFAQEDSFVEGTGLGMNLVAKIIKAMGGKIDVQSEKGAGTTMTVTVPVDMVGKASKEAATANQEGIRKPGEGTTIHILCFQELGAEPPANPDPAIRKMVLNSIERSCHSLGIHTRRSAGAEYDGVDAYLISEWDLKHFASKPQTEDGSWKAVHGRPVIVFCNSAVSIRELRANRLASVLKAQRVEYISQPCSTKRLGTAVKNCLEAGLNDQAPPTSEAEQASADSEPTTTPVRSSVEQLQPSFGLPITPNTEVNPMTKFSAIQSPPIHSPRPLGPGMAKAASGEDYRSARSRSTSGRPASLHVIDQGSVKKPSLRKATTQPAASSGMSLLLVDDNRINIQLLVTYAIKQGHRKVIATDGRQAVEAYKAACLGSGSADTEQDTKLNSTNATRGTDHNTTLDKPQVILMDINMPVLNGFEATRQIRVFEQQHGIQPAHIIALTGLGSASAQQEASSSGVDLFLTKPVRLQELTKVLTEFKTTMEEEKHEVKAGAVD